MKVRIKVHALRDALSELHDNDEIEISDATLVALGNIRGRKGLRHVKRA